jgi:hypothetical protein
MTNQAGVLGRIALFCLLLGVAALAGEWASSLRGGWGIWIGFGTALFVVYLPFGLADEYWKWRDERVWMASLSPEERREVRLAPWRTLTNKDKAWALFGLAGCVFAVCALCLAGCAPEDPQAAAHKTQCEAAASVAGSPYSTPGMVEFALETYRTKCLGMTADGSRQLRPGAPASSPKPLAITPSDDDVSMFRKDMQAVPVGN